jgi:hypothetical protein
MNNSKKHGACDSPDSSPVFCKVAKLDTSVAESQDAVQWEMILRVVPQVLLAWRKVWQPLLSKPWVPWWNVSFADKLLVTGLHSVMSCVRNVIMKDQNMPNKSIRHHAYRCRGNNFLKCCHFKADSEKSHDF